MRRLLNVFEAEKKNYRQVAICIEKIGVSFAYAQKTATGWLLDNCGLIKCQGDTEVIKALKTIKELDDDESQCVSILTPGNYQYALCELPNVASDQIIDALKWRLEDYIDFPIENAAVDYIQLPQGPEGASMGYHFVSPKDVIGKQQEMLKYAGFDVIAVDVPELCFGNLALLSSGMEQSTAFVKLHPSQSTVILVSKGEIELIRTLNIDMSPLYQKVSHHLSLEEKASKRELIDELAVEIQRTSEYVRTVLKQLPPQSLYLSPLSFSCQDFLDELQESLGLSTHMIDCNSIIQTRSAFSVKQLERSFIALCGALRQESLPC